MNINELMLNLNKTLHESGWIEKATVYFKKHPEYFNKSERGNTYLASIDMSFSLFIDNLNDVDTPTVMICVSARGSDGFIRMCDEYNGKICSEVLGITRFTLPDKEEISFEEFCEHVHNHTYCTKHSWTTGMYQHDTLSLTYEQVDEWLQAQDVKDEPVCYKDSRHAWIEIGGGFWENIKTGEQGQDKVILEVWFDV